MTDAEWDQRNWDQNGHVDWRIGPLDCVLTTCGRRMPCSLAISIEHDATYADVEVPRTITVTEAKQMSAELCLAMFREWSAEAERLLPRKPAAGKHEAGECCGK